MEFIPHGMVRYIGDTLVNLVNMSWIGIFKNDELPSHINNFFSVPDTSKKLPATCCRTRVLLPREFQFFIHNSCAILLSWDSSAYDPNETHWKNCYFVYYAVLNGGTLSNGITNWRYLHIFFFLVCRTYQEVRVCIEMSPKSKKAEKNFSRHHQTKLEIITLCVSHEHADSYVWTPWQPCLKNKSTSW